MTRTLFAGPDPRAATDRALTWAADTADEHPAGILCLTQTDAQADRIRRHWRRTNDPLRLTCQSLDAYVGTRFERATGTLATNVLRPPERDRLIEAAIERYGADETTSPLATQGAPPRELVEHVQGAVSLLEHAGYPSADALRSALEAAGGTEEDGLDPDALYGAFRASDPPAGGSLATQAAVLGDVYAEYEHLRDIIGPAEQRLPAEQYLALLDDDRLIPTVPDSVEAVVLAGLTRLAPVERATVARLVEAYPTVAALGLVHESLSGRGIDAGLERGLALYRALEFTIDYDVPPGTNADRLAAVRSLATPDPAPMAAESTGIDRRTPATEREEVRTIARRVRALLGQGVAPSDIGIVVTDRATYRSLLAEVLPAYDIPFTFVNAIGIEQTLVGEAVQSVLDLTADGDRVRALRELAANALVSLSAYNIGPHRLRAAADAIPTGRLDALLEQLETDGATTTAAGIRDLVADIDDSDRSLMPFVLALEDVLDTLGLPDAVAAYASRDAPTGSHRPAFEASAWDAVTGVLASFEPVAPHLAADAPADRIRRGLRAELVRGPAQQPGYVRVLPLAEAGQTSFEHLFVAGLTMGYFPNEGDTMAFFAAINDAAEEFRREHTGHRARAILGTLITGSDDVTLSTPRHTVDGADHTPAPFVAELADAIATGDQSSTFGAASSDQERTESAPTADRPHVTGEDVQRAYGSWAARETFDDLDRATEPLATADGLPPSGRSFATRGVRCAWRRSRPALTAHDAQVPAVLGALGADLEPFSPSALEDYARCPFVFMMKRVLGFEEDYGDDDGFDRGDRGTYIHRVLANFYRALRVDGAPVDLTTYDRETLDATLRRVAMEQLAAAEIPDTPFARRTIGRLLAGLGDPADNPYYDAGGGADGLFVRFLDTELEHQPTVATRPAYLEAGIGVDREGVEQLTDEPYSLDTPAGPVAIRGIADRVDVAPGAPPHGFHVRDYKTGSVPGRTDITAGLHLQVPIYGAVLAPVLEDRTGDAHRAVAGSYYALKHPDSIDPIAGLVAARDAVDPETGAPMAQPPAQTWRLPFDTQAEFEAFVHEVTPARVGRIAHAARHGRFQPTLLTPTLANCEDCTFRDTCDVRHHHREETIAGVDPGDHYVSERARGVDFDPDGHDWGWD